MFFCPTYVFLETKFCSRSRLHEFYPEHMAKPKKSFGIRSKDSAEFRLARKHHETYRTFGKITEMKQVIGCLQTYLNFCRKLPYYGWEPLLSISNWARGSLLVSKRWQTVLWCNKLQLYNDDQTSWHSKLVLSSIVMPQHCFAFSWRQTPKISWTKVPDIVYGSVVQWLEHLPCTLEDSRHFIYLLQM